MSTPDWNDEVWNAAVRYVGTSLNTNEERRLVARVIRAERTLAAERVKQLEEALRPFSDMAGELFARNWNASDMVVALDNPDEAHRVTAQDFFRARNLLNGGSNERA